MAAPFVSVSLRPLHPLHAMLLAFPFPLFLGAFLSDLAYWNSFEIQWANFSSWLIAGGLVGGGFALLWAVVELCRYWEYRDTRLLARTALLALMWVLGFINALVHARDAFATMSAGLYLSAIVMLLALAALWIGHSAYRYREVV